MMYYKPTPASAQCSCIGIGRSACAAKGAEKEWLTLWNIISAKFKLRPCPYSECTSTVWAVRYTVSCTLPVYNGPTIP